MQYSIKYTKGFDHNVNGILIFRDSDIRTKDDYYFK